MPSAKRPLCSDKEPGEEVTRKKTKKDVTVQEKESLAGSIEKISMKNFMCHSAMEVALNRRINFIVGRNGSGKSAILTAVVIALGGKAASTNRGSSLKDFIKTGANSAMVEVTLNNIGLRAYKSDIYGPKIIVARTIYSGSTPSSYKFKSATGKVISTKREELEKITTAFNLQVDNPISVLNQDTARTFLASTDPKSKYTIFMKATKLEAVNNLHSKTLECEVSVANRLKLRKESMKSQENEIKALEKKANALRKLGEVKMKILQLENEYCWAMAREEEKTLTELHDKIGKEKEKIISHQNQLEKYKKEREVNLNSLSEIRAQLEEINGMVKEANEKFVKSNQELKEKNAAYKNSLLKFKQFKKEERKYEYDMKIVRQEIEKHKGGHNNANERVRLTEDLKRCNLEQNSITAIQQTAEMERQNLLGESEHFQEQKTSLQAEKSRVQKKIETKMSQLESIRSESDNLTMYGEWMPRLVQRIEAYHSRRQFDRKPLGPLGAFVKVQNPEWARAIEIELSNVLRSFACHNGKDSKLLQQIFKEVIRNDRNPGIIVSKFTDKLHDIRNASVETPKYKNIFESLHISDVNVANTLIDNNGIEGILLIPTGEEAAKVMSSNVPRNCRKALTLKADQYFPYPDYRMYAGNKRLRASLLQVSRSDNIRQLESDIEYERQNEMVINSKLNELKEKLVLNMNNLEEVKKRILDLRASKARLNEKINELENAIDSLPDPQHFLTLNSELESLQRKVEDVLEKVREADEESDQLKINCQQAAEKVRGVQDELKKVDESRQKLQVQYSNQNETVSKIESKIHNYEVMGSELSKHLDEMNESLRKQEKQTQDAVKNASTICPERIRTKRPLNTIKSEITDHKTYQQMVETDNGLSLDVIDKLKETKAKFQANIDQMCNIEKAWKVLKECLLCRKNLYSSIQKTMSVKVTYMFLPLLSNRGYKGNMVFDHNEKTLIVEVSPKQEKGKRETKSLSGGERSYSTVSFILALWECVEPPFYFMDEFDVFMDRVNRRAVLEMLLMQAREKKQHQYVFLTPQDTSIVQACEFITIHKLDDPERTATK